MVKKYKKNRPVTADEVVLHRPPGEEIGMEVTSDNYRKALANAKKWKPFMKLDRRGRFKVIAFFKYF